jgi:hypothetical protein
MELISSQKSRMETSRLIELWHDYFAAFNSHSMLALQEFYDRNCQIIVDGEIVANDRNSMMVNYADVWEKMNTTPVEALEVTPIEHGLSVLMRDRTEGEDGTVEYLYNDKGLHIAHIVNTKTTKKIPENA